ncbi:hypothetical protein [Staphylococcus massiliensis]|uniref:Permease n=1 Tax=Staphylococcus massiliensis S46 TaxID=1229783 RepID=K9AYJ4_9STAP|nr:hypothetical protein [Staphylococcus massiliensis]EKU46590.1 hypothetical protein C273_09076 [Staphylococcus massiliensis S46]MCG3399644.1 hypothetical protein [Staphylococcus massiliensis]MCG3400748.1 hypothetical protein [Staphylococcus massiliensis]MCG3412087.1 hypothetical protein [Staphylococcus massiliensis]PNZ97723.1 hypothetical protein CD133_10220 [Staphylococcus massiliensis CCUG 55927]
MKLKRFWIHLMILTVIVSLLSIKGFPIALGALYLPVFFKVVELQMNLSKGLTKEDVPAHTFIKSNQTGVVVSVVCIFIITAILFNVLGSFYNGLNGLLGTLVTLSPITLIIAAILYILTAIAVIQRAKDKFSLKE